MDVHLGVHNWDTSNFKGDFDEGYWMNNDEWSSHSASIFNDLVRQQRVPFK